MRAVSISGASEAHSLSVTDNELHVYDVDAAGASVHTVYAQKVTGEFQQNALRLENVILKSAAVVGVSAGYPKPTGTIRAVGNVGSAAGSTLRTAYGADVNYGDAVVEGNELHLSDVTMRAEYNSDNHFFGQISKAAGPPRSPRERSRSPAPSTRSARPTTIKTSISQAPTRSPGAPRRAA